MYILPLLLSLGVDLFAQGAVPERFTGILGLDDDDVKMMIRMIK